MVLAVLLLTPTPMLVMMPMVLVLDTDRGAGCLTLGLGDPFGPGFPLQSPLRSDFRCNPYRLRSLTLTARSACPPGWEAVPKFLTRCPASAVRSSRPPLRAADSPRRVPLPRHAPAHRSLHFPPRRCGLRPSPGCAPRRAPVPAQVRAPLPTPPAARFARLPPALSAVPATQAPWRLPSAGFAGVDSLIAHTADWPLSTAGAALGLTPHAAGCRGMPWVSMAGPFGDSRCHWVSGCCWIERMSHRHTLFVISWAACGCACHPPIYALPGTDIRPTYDRHTPVSLSVGTAVAACPRPTYGAMHRRWVRTPSNALRTPLAIAILVWFWYQENFRNEGSRPSIRDIRDTVQAPRKGA